MISCQVCGTHSVPATQLHSALSYGAVTSREEACTTERTVEQCHKHVQQLDMTSIDITTTCLCLCWWRNKSHETQRKYTAINNATHVIIIIIIIMTQRIVLHPFITSLLQKSLSNVCDMTWQLIIIIIIIINSCCSSRVSGCSSRHITDVTLFGFAWQRLSFLFASQLHTYINQPPHSHFYHVTTPWSRDSRWHCIITQTVLHQSMDGLGCQIQRGHPQHRRDRKHFHFPPLTCYISETVQDKD